MSPRQPINSSYQPCRRPFPDSGKQEKASYHSSFSMQICLSLNKSYLVVLSLLMQAVDRYYLCYRTFAEVSCEDNNQEDLKSKAINAPYDPDQDYLKKVNPSASRKV